MFENVCFIKTQAPKPPYSNYRDYIVTDYSLLQHVYSWKHSYLSHVVHFVMYMCQVNVLQVWCRCCLLSGVAQVCLTVWCGTGVQSNWCGYLYD